MAGCTLARCIKNVNYFASHRSIYSRCMSSSGWQIVGAACVTRPPVICPPMSSIQQQYSQMLTEMENELSLKSDHELRIEQDRIYKEVLKSGEADDMDLEIASKQTAMEYEDACKEQLKNFKATLPDPGTYITNNGSLGSSLDRAAILVVKQQLGDNQEWIFPQAPWQPGETLRQTCERVVQESCGKNLKVKFLGNAPCGFHKYKYPKMIRKDGYIGAKVFFYKCQVCDSAGNNVDMETGPHIHDHQWLPIDKLDSKLKNSYAKSVAQFLISDQ